MKIILSFLLLLSIFSCDHLTNKVSTKGNQIIDTVLYSMPTKISLHDTFIDLGTVKEGDVKKIVYHYTNSGDKPLVIFNVSPSCGCTIADFSHEPLAVGASDSIVAKFDSQGKDGSYQKSIKVNCNTEEKVHTLAFKVNVVK